MIPPKKPLTLVPRTETPNPEATPEEELSEELLEDTETVAEPADVGAEAQTTGKPAVDTAKAEAADKKKGKDTDPLLQEIIAASQSGRPEDLTDKEKIKAWINILRRLQGGADGLKPHEVAKYSAHLLVRHLTGHGQILQDGGEYFLLVKDKVVPLRQRERNLHAVLSEFDLMRSESLTKLVIDHIIALARTSADPAMVYMVSHYDQQKHALYLSMFDGKMLYITADEKRILNNGDHGVAFIPPPGCSPYTINFDKIGTTNLFEDHILASLSFEENGMSPAEQKSLIKIWALGFFFPEKFPTKVILTLIGAAGSKKTSTLRAILQTFLGPKFEVNQTPRNADDFDTTVTNKPFFMLDDLDNVPGWLRNRLAVLATGGNISKRKKYTTNNNVEYAIRSYCAITSRNPKFRQEDIAQRMLLIKLIAGDREFGSEADRKFSVLQLRNDLMTEIVGDLQEVVRALQSHTPVKTEMRMGDFANFALAIANHKGQGKEMALTLKRLSFVQRMFIAEHEPITVPLESWLRVNEGANRERDVTATQLCAELAKIAKLHEQEFPYRGKGMAFAQKLPTMDGTLQLFGMETKCLRGRVKTYKFTRIPEELEPPAPPAPPVTAPPAPPAPPVTAPPKGVSE